MKYLETYFPSYFVARLVTETSEGQITPPEQIHIIFTVAL